MRLTFHNERDLHAWINRNDPFQATNVFPCHTWTWKRIWFETRRMIAPSES